MGNKHNNKLSNSKKAEMLRKQMGMIEKPKSKILKFLKSGYGILIGILGFVATLLGIYLNLTKLKEPRLSQKESFVKEKFDTGHLEALRVSNNDSNIYESINYMRSAGIADPYQEIRGIYIPNFFSNKEIIFQAGSFISGIPSSLFRNEINICKVLGYDLGVPILAIVKNDRLYLSLQIKDFLTNDIIGWMLYNNWKLVRTNTLWYNNDDKRLEVYDSHHNICLSLNYIGIQHGQPTVKIAGYFYSGETLEIVTNKGTPNPGKDSGSQGYISNFDLRRLEWKHDAEKTLKDIKSIFDTISPN